MFDIFGEEKKRKRTLTEAQKKHIISAVGVKCEWCGEKDPTVLEVHHIKPIEEGGTDTPSNLIVLCAKCHRKADRGLIPRGDLRKKVSKRSDRVKKAIRGIFQKKKMRQKMRAKGSFDFDVEIPDIKVPKIEIQKIDIPDTFGSGKKKKGGRKRKKKDEFGFDLF